MRNSVLPVLAVLTVIAGAVGLQLGETTIGQIDPLYFQGAAPPVRDVTANSARRNAYAQASGWAEGYQARAAECGDCPSFARRARGPMVVAVPLYAYSDPTIEPRWEQAAAETASEDLELAREDPPSAVQRYLHYTVSADQAEIRAGLEGAKEATVPGPPGL